MDSSAWMNPLRDEPKLKEVKPHEYLHDLWREDLD